MKTLMPKITHINKPNPDKGNQTFLNWACHSGTEDIVEYLISNNASHTSTDSGGGLPIHWASAYGKEEIVSLLLERGSLPLINNQDNTGFTPLHLAAYKGHCNVVKTLVKNDANIDISNICEKTPLMMAKDYKKEDVVGILKQEEERRQSPSYKLHLFLLINDLADIEPSLRRTPLGVKCLSDLEFIKESDLVGGAKIDVVPARRLLKAVRELNDKVESQPTGSPSMSIKFEEEKQHLATLSQDSALSSILYAELDDIWCDVKTKTTDLDSVFQRIIKPDFSSSPILTLFEAAHRKGKLPLLGQSIKNVCSTGVDIIKQYSAASLFQYS